MLRESCNRLGQRDWSNTMMYSTKSRRSHALPLAACLLWVCSTLHAQVAGRINGYVKDPSGANVAHATVKAVSVEQQLTRTAETDETGYYNLLAVPPGVYEVSAECTGFERQRQTGVSLTQGQTLRLDMEIKVGAVQSEITVSSQGVLVNTTNQTPWRRAVGNHGIEPRGPGQYH